MSMTQVAFLKKADLPTKTEIESNIVAFPKIVAYPVLGHL